MEPRSEPESQPTNQGARELESLALGQATHPTTLPEVDPSSPQIDYYKKKKKKFKKLPFNK